VPKFSLLQASFRKKRRRDVQIGTVPRGPVGHFGGIRDGEVFGWALNSQNLAEPARVTAYVNGRPTAEALAVYYRPDVAQHLNCSGRHGFYLDLSRSDVSTDAMVDVRLANGRYLRGVPVHAHLPRRPRLQTPTLLFMHIAKTAGTALRETILNNYKQSDVAYIYPDPPGFPVRNLRDLPLSQRAQFAFVVGHFQYGIHEEIPNDYSYFTIVRNPVHRIWSHYQYLVEYNSHLAVENGRVKSLEEVLENRVTANLDNMMVRCFAGVDEGDFPPGSINADVYDLALRHAQDAFLFIGHQERIGDAYSFLQEKFGWHWSVPPETMNSGSYAAKEQIGDLDAKLVKQFNYWDCKLYEHIGSLFP
jgi:Sulfotransferase family